PEKPSRTARRQRAHNGRPAARPAPGVTAGHSGLSTAVCPRALGSDWRSGSRRTARPPPGVRQYGGHRGSVSAPERPAIGVGRGRSDPLITHAKMLRLELLKVKADLERPLEDFSLSGSTCGLDVHLVSGLGIRRVTGRTGNPRRTATPSCSRSSLRI